MTSFTNLDSRDLECLGWVAVGRPDLVSEASLERLRSAGLVRQPERIAESAVPLELTPAGLALIRSSDQ
ncbi:hypothetical protein ISN76_11090 [Dyella halodurans]|uniref:ArsR family transcriptional regulator n=1 Tax=Dyella halodurans TaxID=1920171 RepID=A0ABV9C2T9_9GAMM|nr:hypothetical protein [Dyella halodurans]